MKEGDRYTRDSMRHIKIPYRLVLKRYWTRIIPVSIIWFIYDFSVYSFGIYSSTIIERVIPDTVHFIFFYANVRLYINHSDGTSSFFCFIFPALPLAPSPLIILVQNTLLRSASSSKPSLDSLCLDYMSDSLNILVRLLSCVVFHHIKAESRWSILVIWGIRTGR